MGLGQILATTYLGSTLIPTNKEIHSRKLVVHISCTAQDRTLDFTKNKMEEKNLFDFVYNMCSPEANKKPKKIELMWIRNGNT